MLVNRFFSWPQKCQMLHTQNPQKSTSLAYWGSEVNFTILRLFFGISVVPRGVIQLTLVILALFFSQHEVKPLICPLLWLSTYFFPDDQSQSHSTFYCYLSKDGKLGKHYLHVIRILGSTPWASWCFLRLWDSWTHPQHSSIKRCFAWVAQSYSTVSTTYIMLYNPVLYRDQQICSQLERPLTFKSQVQAESTIWKMCWMCEQPFHKDTVWYSENTCHYQLSLRRNWTHHFLYPVSSRFHTTVQNPSSRSSGDIVLFMLFNRTKVVWERIVMFLFVCSTTKSLLHMSKKKNKQTKKNVPVPVIRMNLTAVRAAWAVVVTQISLNDSPVQSNTLHGNVDSFLVFRQLVAVSSDGLSLHEFYIRTQNGAVWLKEFTWRGSEDHSWNAWDSSVPSQ